MSLLRLPKSADSIEGAISGKLAQVMAAAQSGNTEDALAQAWRWRAEAPGDVLALVALGEALEAAKDLKQAARAYGSIIDLFSSRADLRRMAGNRLERIATAAALELAIDTYEKAREERPDHPSSHRMYAWALVKAQRYEEAFRALRGGYERSYPSGRFRGVKEILGDDLKIIATAWLSVDPQAEKGIAEQLQKLGFERDTQPSLRFILSWETDANDVDFHIYDGAHGHAYYSHKTLPAGGRLFADVTNGYGPECFRIDHPKAYPYELSAHYYSKGPMGYDMGKLEVVRHDGKGHLVIEDRPYVIMKDRAFIHLGLVDKPK